MYTNMLANIVLIVSLATLAVSSPTQKNDAENELITTFLGSGTNIMREFSKLVVGDADKFSVDLNALYKKYEIADKTKSIVEAQYNIFAEFTYEYIKIRDMEYEEIMRKNTELIKTIDPVLAEKLSKFNAKAVEINRLGEDIIKSWLDKGRVNGLVKEARESLYPIEHDIAKSIKKFETAILENFPKKGRQ